MNRTDTFVRTLDPHVMRDHQPLREYAARLGGTPLVEVPGVERGAKIFAKLEWENPNGTVKDRVAFGMVYRLLCATPRGARGKLHILEYSGGSLGNSLSALCHELSIPLTLVMPSLTNPGVVAALRDHGTEVILSPAEEAFWGVIELTRQLAEEHPHWSFLFQHQNAANLWMHRETTGREIINGLPVASFNGPCAWVTAVGTGGTLVGVREALVEAIPQLQTYVTCPLELPYGAEGPPNGLPKFLGAGGFGLGRKQPFVAAIDSQLAGQLCYSFDTAIRGVKAFHGMTGMRIGSSAAANWLAAKEIAARLGPTGTVVTVFPSGSPDFEWRRVQIL